MSVRDRIKQRWIALTYLMELADLLFGSLQFLGRFDQIVQDGRDDSDCAQRKRMVETEHVEAFAQIRMERVDVHFGIISNQHLVGNISHNFHLKCGHFYVFYKIRKLHQNSNGFCGFVYKF